MDYLNNRAPDAFSAQFEDGSLGALVASSNGPFWLTRYKDDGAFLVFPTATNIGSSDELEALRELFDCPQSGKGELYLCAPAVSALDVSRRRYLVTQKGRLDVVRPRTPPPMPPLPELTSLREVPVKVEVVDENVRPVVLDYPSIGDEASPLPQFPRRLKLAVGGALVVVIALVGSIFYPTQKRKIISQLKQGNLVTPAGESAYDLFQRAGLSGGDSEEVRRVAAPVLEARGGEAIRRLTYDGYRPQVAELDEIARVYEWLGVLSPQDSFQARKHYFLGRKAYENKDLNGAENQLRQSMRLEPGWALPVNTLGRVYFLRKNYLTTQALYSKAIEIDPSWMVPRINLCVLSVENTKNYQLAESSCRGVLQLDANKAAGHYFLGLALEAQGRGCEALASYHTAEGLASNSTDPGFSRERLSQRINLLSRRVSCGN